MMCAKEEGARKAEWLRVFEVSPSIIQLGAEVIMQAQLCIGKRDRKFSYVDRNPAGGIVKWPRPRSPFLHFRGKSIAPLPRQALGI